MLRIALGTDDNNILKRERFGDSIQFRIVAIEQGVVVTSELRPNPFANPAIENKPPRILGLLYDCDAFVGRSWRAGSFTLFTENGKKVYLSEMENLHDIIAAFIRPDYSRLQVFSLERQKFVSAELPQ